jgi:hypothetical protein
MPSASARRSHAAFLGSLASWRVCEKRRRTETSHDDLLRWRGVRPWPRFSRRRTQVGACDVSAGPVAAARASEDGRIGAGGIPAGGRSGRIAPTCTSARCASSAGRGASGSGPAALAARRRPGARAGRLSSRSPRWVRAACVSGHTFVITGREGPAVCRRWRLGGEPTPPGFIQTRGPQTTGRR